MIEPPARHAKMQCHISLENIDIYCSHGVMLALLPIKLLLRVLYFQKASTKAVAKNPGEATPKSKPALRSDIKDEKLYLF